METPLQNPLNLHILIQRPKTGVFSKYITPISKGNDINVKILNVKATYAMSKVSNKV